MLFVIATPIGNLKDFSFRAIETLKDCDLVLCEDTRRSKILFSEYGIAVKTHSFHKFSEREKEGEVLRLLKEGKKIGLVSDAGTPTISDPGQRLIALCHEEKIPVSGIPGPSALIFALSLSGFDGSHFQFVGFIPKKPGEKEEFLKKILLYPGTTIAYESPERLISFLKLLEKWIPLRKIAVGRELTKKFEEIKVGNPQDLILDFSKKEVKGECVVLIEGDPLFSQKEWKKIISKELVKWLQKEFPLSSQEAIRLTADLKGIPKRLVYKEVIDS